MNWIEHDRAHVWHPYTQMLTAPQPIPVVGGEGSYLITSDGRRILDGISSWWVNLHGHNHPRLNQALARQAGRLSQVIFAGFTHEPASRLAHELCAVAPAGLEKVFYSDNGSTAVEVALKMAYQACRQRGEPERGLFVAFDDSYHGDTFGAMSAGGVGVFHSTFADLFFQVRRAGTPNSATRENRGKDLEELLEGEGSRVAAVIVEPLVQAAGGMIPHPAEFLRKVRDWTRRHGIFLIADEVFTGFGRTGAMFACQRAGIEPDLMCLSKGLTGGYLPLGATLATQEIYEAFLSEDRLRTFFHGHSYTGNALSCAVARESLALMEEEDCLSRVGSLEGLFRSWTPRFEALPTVSRCWALGGLLAMEIAPKSQRGYLDETGPRLYHEFLKRDILLRPLGNVLYFLPPYVITDAEATSVLSTMERVLSAI